MNHNWRLCLKRAFRLAELLVAGALLAVLVELLLVHLDRPSASPDVILIKRAKLVEVAAPVPAMPPTKAMPMQVAAKPVPPPPVVQAPMVREIGREQMGSSGNNTTINFVSLLQFRHLRARFGQPANDDRPAQTQTTSASNQNFPSVVIGPSGISVPGSNQIASQTNTVLNPTNRVVSTNTTRDSLEAVVAANDKRPAKLKPSEPSSLPPAFGNIRLALP